MMMIFHSNNNKKHSIHSIPRSFITAFCNIEKNFQKKKKFFVEKTKLFHMISGLMGRKCVYDSFTVSLFHCYCRIIKQNEAMWLLKFLKLLNKNWKILHEIKQF